MNSPQPVGLDMRMPLLREEVAVERALGVVLGASSGDSSTLIALGVVVGEIVARRARRCPCGRRWGRRASSRSASRPSLRSGVAVRPRRNGARHDARRERVGRLGQVVALVEDHQPEASAEVLHVEVRRVVGRTRSARATSCSPPPTTPTGHAERRREKIVPLAHQIERRRDDQRAAPLVVDGHDRHLRLAGAGGQHDDAATRAVATPRAPRPGRGAARGARARPGRARRSRARGPRTGPWRRTSARTTSA